MENNGVIITQEFIDDGSGKTIYYGDIDIKIKKGTDTKTLFHNIVNILAWSAQRQGTDPQQIMDWIKSRNFFSELVYNPPV